ncbi:alcohol dehydrogenase class-3 [Quercus suber]|uniref:Alcohol dehydrogenase class-3 n=1 Tax=Quercus suber TaxID=58331 RepID=A0AAW0LYG6_QUESU
MAKRDLVIITCKAAVCWGNGEPVKVEEIQVEPPKSSEVRVKILYASVCHTDLLFIKGFPIPLFPRVLGHEGVGVVESVGEEVTDLKEGDLVIPTSLGECEDCENCLSGKTNLCLKYPVPSSGLMPDETSRMSIRGQRLYHAFTCSTGPRFGAAWKDAKVESGSTVAVLGLGAVGLGAIQGARVQGAAKIIGIDTNERKKTKGAAFGMTDFINPNDNNKSISQLIKELTGGLGVDYCFECTGVPSLINEALQATKMGKGQTLVIGAGNDQTVQVNFISLLFGGTLKGSILGGLKFKTDLPFIIDKCKNKVNFTYIAY